MYRDCLPIATNSWSCSLENWSNGAGVSSESRLFGEVAVTQIDEFESLFNSAAKPTFQLESVAIHRVLIVLDEAGSGESQYIDRIRNFLGTLEGIEKQVEIQILENPQFASVADLLEQTARWGPDLICTYRNLRIPATDYPYSLGVYVDVLTQATSIPVLLFPRPEQMAPARQADSSVSTHFSASPGKVIAVTDHLAGDRHLVTLAATFTASGGELILAHIEDEQTFERYIETISRIPEIDTDVARQTLMDQLLKEPRDYIESCRIGIQQAGLPLSVSPLITVGHHLADYRHLIREHEADLVVLNTKDSDQLAMHGLAYPLSVELRERPMLLI